MSGRRIGLLVACWVASGISIPASAAIPRRVDVQHKPIPRRPVPSPDLRLMRIQAVLDHLGFSPGVVDGRPGSTLRIALSAFQTVKGLAATGSLNPATLQALAQYPAVKAVRSVMLAPADLSGSFVGRLPARIENRAELSSMGYANALDMLAERYHTTPATLVALNSPATRIAAGTRIRVPDTATWSRAYPKGLPDHYRSTLAGLNVSAAQPRAAKLIVSKAARSLSVYDAAGRLVARFPVTTGSQHDPLPIGNWKVVSAAYNPRYYFNPKRFWDARSGDRIATLQPGPRGPVGIVWLGLDRPHFGIHGTPSPQSIGRTESHGCIRLTNWDAGRLSLMVRRDTIVLLRP